VAAADGADASGPERVLGSVLRSLLSRYDVVLVEGHRGTPLPKVWIAAEGETEPPPGVTNVRAVLPRDPDRPERLRRHLEEWLPGAWREPPVRAGILVGGASRRMGRPKAALEVGGRTFLERTVDALRPHAEEIVLLGAGPVPEAAAELPRLPDPPGLGGPLAGILGALRWGPDTTWVVAGCDQPLIDPDAVAWLLDRRAPGTWAVLPRLGDAGVEPLLAAYDARARWLLEGMAAAGRLAPSRLAEHPRVACPRPAGGLAGSWRNVNTPEELAVLRRELEERDRDAS
jgi:molybdopterin-guanine dinucleotide biosynthesis protein A